MKDFYKKVVSEKEAKALRYGNSTTTPYTLGPQFPRKYVGSKPPESGHHPQHTNYGLILIAILQFAEFVFRMN